MILYPLPDPIQERQILRRMYRRQAMTVLQQTFVTARFRLLSIVLYSILLWGFLFGIAYGGFDFLHSVLESINLYQTLLRALLGLFFVVILAMLSFSTAILLHSFLFHASDIPLLMTLPLREERVFLIKLDQSQLLAGWAFMLAGSSILSAMGLVDHVPWTFYPYMIAVLLMCTQICAAIGAILTWILLRFFPLHRIPWIFSGLIFAGIAYLVIVYLLPLSQTTESEMASLNWIQNVFGRFRGFENRLIPSWWATAGLLRAASGNLREAIPFLVLLLANALFLRMVAGLLAARWYRTVLGAGIARQINEASPSTTSFTKDTQVSENTEQLKNKLNGQGITTIPRRPRENHPTNVSVAEHPFIQKGAPSFETSASKPQPSERKRVSDFRPIASGRLRRMGFAMDRGLDWALRLFRCAADSRAMILKDWKLFRREPGQWGQVGIALTMVGMYLVNVRRMHFEIHAESWSHFIGLMNLFVVGLLLGTSATRFVYPLVSQEGAHFQTLTQLPLDRDRLLKSKFLFALLGLWIPAALLILLGDVLFQMDFQLCILHQAIGFAYSTGLSGIAVGLGASYPDLREGSSAKVASGFGGTLNLVLGATYVILLLVGAAIPSHLSDLATSTTIIPHTSLKWIQYWQWVGVPSCGVLAMIASTVPVWIGMRRFRKAEF